MKGHKKCIKSPNKYTYAIPTQRIILIVINILERRERGQNAVHVVKQVIVKKNA